jgi:hypothetical protein
MFRTQCSATDKGWCLCSADKTTGLGALAVVGLLVVSLYGAHGADDMYASFALVCGA